MSPGLAGELGIGWNISGVSVIVLLSTKISTKNASVSVWVNHPQWPRKIQIVVHSMR
jgi:hypothetical protein